MKHWIFKTAFAMSSIILVASAGRADTTQITAGLNAPVIGASGGSSVFWGPIVTQTTLDLSGNTNTNYPQKYAGSSISGSGGAAGSRQYCVNPGDPTSGPGTIIPPSTVPVYEWFCDVSPVPPAPQVDFTYYKQLAQAQGNVCGGQPCYNASPSANFSGIYDPVCTVNGQAKVWFFEGDVSFSGGTYFCGVLLSRGAVTFTGGGAGDVTMTPPSTAWQQYQVATPNGAAGFGDTVAQDEYPGDGGLNTVKPYRFQTGGGGFNGDPVSFQGYIYATTGYTAGGHTLVVGAVQFGQGAASTSGGGTIFYVPQIIYTVPPNSQVSTPVITPPGGSFTGSVSVTIADVTPGASIYYTLDGSTPDQNSALYVGAFSLATDTVVKAIGMRVDLNPSSVAVANFTITPGPANQAPTVNAGPDQTITLPASVSLNGSATDDGLPNPPAALTYAWNKISGPGTVTFANPAALVTTASFLQAGTYVLELTAFDGQLSASDQMQVTVLAVPPPTVQFSAATYTAAETAGFASVTVTRQGNDLSGTSTVQFATADGPNTVAWQNYVPVNGTITFAPNETTKRVDVPIIMDGVTDGNKTVLLSLSNPAGATLGNPNQATLTITDAGSVATSGSPFINQLIPYSAPVTMTQSFLMEVLGSGFDSNATVLWNGSVSLPVYLRVGSTQIVVTVDPVLWNNTIGSYPVIVRNAGPVDSNQALFTVLPVSSTTVLGPWVVQQPAANPNPTNTTTTQLSVLGGTFSSGGEAVLTYDWELVSAQPYPVSFSANKTNGAKNTTATFAGPGDYYFRVTITDTITGLSVNTNVLHVQVVQKATTLTLTPKTQIITPDQTAHFTATVKDQFGVVMTPTLIWTNTAGSLATGSGSALLSVGGAAQTIHVTASLTDKTLSDFADVAVLYGSGGVASISQSVPAPVPFKSNSGLPGVTFKWLNPGSKIRLYSTDGRLVNTLISDSGGDLLWDLRNADGGRVSSGVYIYILDWNGQRKKGKLVLIL